MLKQRKEPPRCQPLLCHFAIEPCYVCNFFGPQYGISTLGKGLVMRRVIFPIGTWILVLTIHRGNDKRVGPCTKCFGWTGPGNNPMGRTLQLSSFDKWGNTGLARWNSCLWWYSRSGGARIQTWAVSLWDWTFHHHPYCILEAWQTLPGTLDKYC